MSKTTDQVGDSRCHDARPDTKFRKIGPADYGVCVRTLDQICLLVIKHPAGTLGTIRADVEQLARILDRLD